MPRNETFCIHPNLTGDNKKTGVVTPLYPATAYDYRNSENLLYPGFLSTYNQLRLGAIIAGLENAKHGIMFNSGMAAISSTILSLTKEGDHIIFSRDLYGGTLKFATDELIQRGITCTFTENTLQAFESCRKSNTRLVYMESPSNPLLSITDLKKTANWAKKHDIVSVIDNTFATPINQQPLSFGIDIAVHSGTKYFGGHNDLMFGAMATNDPYYNDQINSTAKLYGLGLSPFTCYMAERSIKTLHLRVQQQNKSAGDIASFLHNNSLIKQVYYPGLSTHTNHHIAREQMKGYGGMLAFDLSCSTTKINRFLSALKIIQPALSLGGVESLISSPAATSHSRMTPQERKEYGISESLLRLSVGIENCDDLKEDIEQALKSVFR